MPLKDDPSNQSIAAYSANDMFIFANSIITVNPETSLTEMTGAVKATEFKFGSWTFKQDGSGRLGIYNGTSEVACFNTDGTYVNL